MELRVLRYFLAVCEAKNISKAADVLHISQPSLSRQLKNLEDELGVTLFYRGHQEITLTQEGYYLQEHAEEIVSLTNKTQQNLRHSKIVSGELYIGAGESVAIKRVMTIINEILQNYPQVKIHVFNGNSAMIEGKIERGLLDFGITMGQYDTTQNFNSLTLPESNEYGVIVNKDHPLANQSYITPEDLQNFPIIISKHTADSDNFRDWCIDPQKLNIVATFNLPDNLQYLVKKGQYCLLIYKDLLPISPKDNLCFLPIQPKIIDHNRLICSSRVQLSNVASLFLKMMRDSVRNKNQFRDKQKTI
ncbi:MAG: LysR family transcriptional regulator [Lactobacillus sp.]|uniref:LysR family transcriptional regulator n=1 Tax=Lactobacillus sp. TaxID=1591 RepID=UPI0023D75C63|nr:LysR family transcriptional regulator [Lactobacillus sp.]MDE7050548.1 LysR family transcriptional regulator [Lactobacillus sp.]